MPTTTLHWIEGELVHENRNGTQRTYLPDPQGNTVGLIDSSQSITDSWEYWPYGEIFSGPTNKTTFLYVGTFGCSRDTATRTHMGAREYLQTLGRWMQVDPLWPSESAYVYASASPATYIDFTGYGPSATCIAIGRQIVGGRGNGESDGDVFRRCQKALEAHFDARSMNGWAQNCPGGRKEICETCSFISGLPINCGSYPSCTSTQSGSTIPGISAGLLDGLFGRDNNYDTEACVRLCILINDAAYEGKSDKKLLRKTCIAACNALSKYSCPKLFTRCMRMAGAQRNICMQFYIFMGCPEKESRHN